MSCACASILMSSAKWNQRFYAVVENDISVCPNEREVLFRFCVHLFGRISRHSVFLSLNCNLFSIIKFLTPECIFHKWNSAMNMLGRIDVSILMSSANKWTLR